MIRRMEMTEENVKNTAEEAIADDAVAENAPESAPQDEKAEKKKNKKADARITELESKLAEAENALAEQNETLMRMAAEYDYVRKRSAKEKDSIYADAYADAIKNVLPIIDNLERAVGVEGA